MKLKNQQKQEQDHEKNAFFNAYHVTLAHIHFRGLS